MLVKSKFKQMRKTQRQTWKLSSPSYL